MFCRIYADCEKNTIQTALACIADCLNATQSENHIEFNGITVDVRNNDEYDARKKCEFPDGFLYFKFLIELEFPVESYSYAVDSISKLLYEFWGRRMPAIASCPFEKDLPKKGGFGDQSLPWPGQE